MLFDTHCHLQFKAFEKDRLEVIKKCLEKGLVLNAVGTQKDTSRVAIELAEEHDNIYATIGLHPIQEYKTKVSEERDNFTTRGEQFDEGFYSQLADNEKVIAIGETGLDYFHIPKDKNIKKVIEQQKEVFLKHYELAKLKNLPLVIHVRDAHDDMVEIIQNLGSVNGVMHCFSGNWNHAQIYLNAGLYLGFTGIITFPMKKNDPESCQEMIKVIKQIPEDRILAETDAPYLAPQAYRGKRCEPWMVEEVVKKMAEIRGKEYEEMENILYNNALRLFAKIDEI